MSYRDFAKSMINRTIKRGARRPAGVSRRQKKQFSFEALEDRRVMSAQGMTYDTLAGLSPQSISSNTPEGQAQIWVNELFWQSLASSGQANLQAALAAIPTDPLLAAQWHLINTGQQVGNPDFQPIYGVPGEDINVAPVWNMGLTGQGVVVAVLDSGVQVNHPDLAGNIDPDLQFDAITGDFDANPDLANPINTHGTGVAGLIGAVANNGEGGTGVAPGVQLVPIRLIDAGQTPQAFVDAFRFAMDNGVDITNSSWQAPGGTRGIFSLTPAQTLALRDSIIFGRDGLGLIHVRSAGNFAGTGFGAPGFEPIGVLDSAGYDGWVNSRYTIGVTSVDHDGFYDNVDGTFTGYAETSSSVLVAAPTGSNASLNIAEDTGLGSGIWTTDTTGDTGINIEGYIDDRDFLEDTDYTSRFNGTSASAPLVSGVIALMLEANPNLSWRDVQEILVRSARQNAEFGVPQNGSDQGSGQETLNTWIQNQMPVFHDPDPYSGNPTLDTLFPMLDPNVDGGIAIGTRSSPTGGNISHFQPTPFTITNGAGYTVSMGTGTNGEQIGYAHGVVDAELAVLLAQQWTTKNQTLSPELTFSTFVTTSGNELGTGNIPGAEKGNQASGFQLVPGGLSGQAGFIAYWNEYFADVPNFNQNFADRGGGISFTVPDNNTMSVENVEVKISLSGGTADALDNLRILLVSPNGTHSELNNYYIEPNVPFTLQNITPARFITDGLSEGDDGDMVFTFSSNRSWGERSDDAIVFDPSTKEPVMVGGVPLEGGWQIHFENYGSTAFTLNGMEVVWHGNPIQQNTYRVQGVVGVDDNQDNQFNFSRVDTTILGTPGALRYGDIINTVDETHESMASNVTVVARRASDNVIVDRFVTGADGNYYFDLVPDDYIFSVEDPEGREAIEDTLSASGLLQNYKTEWEVSADFFKIWDYDTNLRVPVDSNGVPLSFNGTVTPHHVKNINFLLDPGPPAAQQVQFSGAVIADLAGDGIFNATDVNVPSITVYADVNRNGALDAGEVSAQTNASGNYSLTVPSTIANVINVGVQMPAGWTHSNPASGIVPVFTEPGDVFTGIDFMMQPPAGSSAGSGVASEPGYLIGSVYEDINNNGSRQANELGVQGVQVYVDANNNNQFDAAERTTTTTANGAFIFANVAQGSQRIRVVPTTPFMSINPGPGVPRIVNLNGGGTVTLIEFGIGLGTNTTTSFLDFGDLPVDFGITLMAENGARHSRSAYYLGTRVVTEADGKPSADATGDDAMNDEDGIVIDPLVAGSTGHLVATASRHGGVLQGWIDFNGDHVFQASEKVISNVDLVAGANNVTFQIPATLTTGDIFARFRYGEYGINSVTGSALIGEVEDYLVPVVSTSTDSTTIPGPDFNKDNKVDGRDFLAWQRGFGKTNATASQGDATGDKKVNGEDLQLWKDEYGSSGSSATVAAAVQAEEFGQDSTTAYEQGDSLDTSFNQLAPVIVSSFTAKSVSGDSEAVTTQEVQDGTTSIAIETQVRQQRGQWRSAARALPSSSSSVDAVFEAASFSASSSRSARSVATSGSQRVAYRFDREELDRQDAGEEAALQEAFGDYQLWSTL